MKDKVRASKQPEDQFKGKGHPIDKTVGLENNLDKLTSTPWKFEPSLEKILEVIPEMLFVTDTKGNFLFTNKPWSEHTGYSPDEAKAITIFDLAHPDYQENIKERFIEVLKGNYIGDFEFKSKTKDGSYIDIQISLSPVPGSKGNVIAACGTGINITERKNVEGALDALLETQDVYRSMVETADKAGIGIGIAQNVGNQEGILVFVNNEIVRLTGYTEEELIGKPFQDILITDNISDFIDRYRTRQAGKELPGYSELWLRRKDGTTVPVECSAGITTHQNKVGTIAYIKEITERKQAEKALLEARDMYRSMVETADKAGIGIVITQNIENKDGIFVFANDEALRISGYTKEEFIGMQFQDILITDNLPHLMDRYKRRQDGEDVSGYSELWLLRKDGIKVPVECSVGITTYQNKVATISYVKDISERKQVEEALYESEQKFRTMFDNALDGICLADVVTRQLYTCNKVFCQMLGYNLEEIQKLEVTDIHPKQDLPYALEQFIRQAAGEITLAKDIPMLRRDGSIFYTDVNSSTITIDGRKYLMGIFRDITDRRNIEEKYRQLLEDIYDGYAVLQDGKYVFTNQRFCEILGYKPGRLLGKHFTRVLMPDDRQSMMELYEKVMSGEEAPPEKFINEVVKADGTTVTAEVNTRPILYDNKIAFSLMIRDVTELKKAQDDLRQSEEYFRSLIENTSDVIDVIGADGNVNYISPSAEQVLGYKPEELIGKTNFELIHPDDLSNAMTSYIQTTKKSRYSAPVEIRIRHKDGSWRIVQAIGNNLLDHPSVAGIVTNIRDITERKWIEEKYRQLLEEMKDGYAVIQDAKIVFANKRCDEIFGYESGQLIGEDITKFIEQDYLQEAMELYMKVINGEEETPERYEVIGMKRDGVSIPIQVGARLIEYDGKPAYSVIIRDITERKESEEKYRLLLETMNDGYIVYQGGRIVLANRRFAEIFGYKLEQVLGQDLHMFVAPEIRQEAIRKYIRVKNGEELPERGVIIGIKVDGTLISVELSIKTIEYDNEPAYSIIFRDITERKIVEDMLHKSQEKLQSILQALPDTLFHANRDGTLLDEPMGNYGIYEQHRSTFSKEKSLFDILPGDVANRALSAIQIALNNGTPQVVEHKMPIPPGTPDDDIYETRIVPFGKDEVLTISRNITAQKLYEMRLHNYQQQLQSLSSQLSQAEERERRRLAVDLHDLISQSLAVIKIKLNAWKDTLQSSGHANSMREVIELLDGAINNTRSLTFDLSPPVLYELGLEAALEFLLEQFQERHALQYEFTDDEQEKPIEDDVRILLYRCVSELLMNVVKHSKAQLVKLSIGRENSQISITLEDDGVGFNFTETEMGGETQGFGLLSIRERLNWVGGSFKLKSKPGYGTHITLKAPLK